MDGYGCAGNQGMTIRSPKNSDAGTVPLDEWRRMASDRSDCYGLLALIFRDGPTSQIVTQLRSPLLAEALGRLGYDVAEDLAGEPKAVAERLGEEYARVFVGPGPHVSPYASVHRDGEGQLWGDSTVRVKRFVEAVGLSFEGNWDSIPDHITVEFELMQRLTAHETELWAQAASAGAAEREKMTGQLCQCLQMEEEFLRDHLCAWVPRFCDRVLSIPTGPFYRQMARLTKSIVFPDLELIAEAQSALRLKSFVCPGRGDGSSRCEPD